MELVRVAAEAVVVVVSLLPHARSVQLLGRTVAVLGDCRTVHFASMLGRRLVEMTYIAAA